MGWAPSPLIIRPERDGDLPARPARRATRASGRAGPVAGRLSMPGQPDDSGGEIPDQCLDRSRGGLGAEFGHGNAQLMAAARAGRYRQALRALGMSPVIEDQKAVALLRRKVADLEDDRQVAGRD